MQLSVMQVSRQQYKWNYLKQHEVENIKDIIMSHRSLKPIKSRSTKTIHLIKNASNTEISSGMQQKDEDLMKSKAFHSRKLNNSPVNYTTTKKELFVI